MCYEGGGRAGSGDFLYIPLSAFFSLLPEPSFLWAHLVKRGLWELWQICTHTFLPHHYLKLMNYMLTHLFLLLFLAQYVFICQYPELGLRMKNEIETFR